MTITKQEINESYQQALHKLVEAQEHMLDFMELAEIAEMDGSVELKRKINKLRKNIYDPNKQFLEDYSMQIGSSEVQTAIDELEDDEEECEHEFESCSDHCKHCGELLIGGHFE